jgi:WD40 repeat protein
MNKLSKIILSVGLVASTLFYTLRLSGQRTAPILWTIDFNPNGKLYAVGGSDGMLNTYDAANHNLLNTYHLPAAVQCLDWNVDAKLLAIGLDSKPVRILNVERNAFVELKGTTGSRAVAWNHNGELLAVADYDGTLKIWNKKGKLIRSIKKENTKTIISVDWHPKKDIILTGGDKIRLFDTAGTLMLSIKHRPEQTIILSIRWHPDGDFFATGDYGEKENHIESLLQFWNKNGTLMKSIKGSQAEYRNIRWNTNGQLLATASDALKIWSKNGTLIYTGKSEDLLWGLDWGKQDTSIITTSEKDRIKLWTAKATLIKKIKD